MLYIEDEKKKHMSKKVSAKHKATHRIRMKFKVRCVKDS